MRKAFAVQSTLLRFGWRATLGQIWSPDQSVGTKVFRILFFALFPLWMVWTQFRYIEKHANAEYVSELFNQLHLPPCTDALCQRLLQGSSIWPEFLQLFWLGIVVALLAMLIGDIFAAASQVNRESTDRELEWIRTFPVKMRSFLWGKLLQKTVFNSYLGMITLPFLLSFLLNRGKDLPWTILTTFLFILASTLVTSSMGMVLDFWIGARFGAKRQRNLRSLMIVLSILPLSFYFVLMAESPAYWAFIMKHGAVLQDAWLTRQLEALLTASAPGLLALPFFLALSLTAAALNIALMQKILQKGAAPQTDPKKEPWRLVSAALDALPTMMRRELALISRDHGHLGRLIVVPFFMLTAALLQDYSDTNPRGHDGYLFMLALMAALGMESSSMQLVNREKSSLWFYASTPHRFSELLKQQRKLIWILGSLVVLIPSAFLLPWDAFQSPIFIFRFGLILIFLKLHDIHTRSTALVFYRPDAGTKSLSLSHLALQMYLSPILVFGLVFGNIWLLVTQFALYIGMVLAFREKALACDASLDDPHGKPPSQADLPAGLILALIYSVVLNTVLAFAYLFRMDDPAEMPWHSLIVSTLVFLGIQLHFRSRQTSDRPIFSGRIGAFPMVLLILGTVAAAGGTWLWMRTTTGWTGFESIYFSLDYRLTPPLGLMLAAAFATVFIEEFIFRGFIQRGLEKRQGFFVAWILSALLTTFCHKPQDFGPVLLISLASGLLYHRTKILWPGLLLGASVHVIRLIWF